jgi:hypothetical protein
VTGLGRGHYSTSIGVLLLLRGTPAPWLIAFVVVYGGAFDAISPLRAAMMADHVSGKAFGAISREWPAGCLTAGRVVSTGSGAWPDGHATSRDDTPAD